MTAPDVYPPSTGLLPTRCPFTFQVLPDPEATSSPFVDATIQDATLPDGWQNSGTLTFAMAGDRSSGKSMYIAVIVKLLRKLVVANGGSFLYADEHTRRIYQEKYEKPLFEQMGLLPPTPPASAPDAHQQRPLIFDISTSNHPEQRLFLVFRDVAGEDLQEENFSAREDELAFFQNADRILFLFDPMSVPRIRQMLEGSVPTHEVDTDGPMVVLRNVLRVLGPDYRPKISLCMSKFDTMQQLAEVNQDHLHYAGANMVNWQRVMSNFGATFRRDSAPLDGAYDRVAGEILDLEIRSMLQCLDATHLLNQFNQPLAGEEAYPFQCFAVSPLGASPEGDRINRSGIAPFRCLDPLRELFSEIGILQGLETSKSTIPPAQPAPTSQPVAEEAPVEEPKKRGFLRWFK
ncbi:hypothetical protein J433_07230 [Corynebacterium glutamicum MT]|uniref:Double-GTPase 2 domain-containing protein n=1 Tax=Corynebacterium glutamicum TaxID=1718 RepID=A0AB36IFQ3_CORGT|nr:hypothetical protein [Corynebacterium glutamicum]AGN20237.1 hypothetical protein C624_13350 [Corynebacterium glutamicum SCgG1]AGN23261.1 hypothetical protein C629_13355 [Corynebacterium glutamicum SCgG2]EGV41884.1 hypothetical protein CgS9114_00665 [Corynebacterium glutamicum S9114]EOA64554.1 hypothetical protein J433_07230 [Corynebacterium glutamicum MT]EPP39666.1 hypothetical protein A583_12889 [Corynebacterium glutamicum Z188]